MVLLRTFLLDGKLHGRQEGILRGQLSVSRKNFWEKPKGLEFCEISENFQFFGETVVAELSKPHSRFPEKHFEKNELLLGKNMILNTFSDFGWKNSIFWPKTSPGVLKLKSTCSKTVFNKFPEKIQFYLFLRNLWRKLWIAQKLWFCQ